MNATPEHAPRSMNGNELDRGRSARQQGVSPYGLEGRCYDPVGLLLAGGTAALVLLWAVAIFSFPEARFAVLAPRAQVGVEAADGIARLLAAFTLFLLALDRSSERLRWVGAGLLVLGVGGITFGYLQKLITGEHELNSSIYAWFIVRSIASCLFVIGLLPDRPPALTSRRLLGVLLLLLALGLGALEYHARLPVLVLEPDLAAAASRGEVPLQGLTGAHWVLAGISLLLSLAALVSAARRRWEGSLGRWLLVAMVLLVGSQLHNSFWPSAYSPVLTTADMLRLAFTLVIVVGSTLELRRIAVQRTELLELERENTRRLEELSLLRADFTAMVAHELGNPLAAIRGLSDVLATGELGPAEVQQVVNAIRQEAAVLTALAADVQELARIERDDFHVSARRVSLDALLSAGATYAAALVGEHPLTVRAPQPVTVKADPERIGQLLRNLLSNAAKYSPAGAPIELRALHEDGRLCIEVADSGYGIHPDDLQRIFEKFGRGRDRSGRGVPGVGLGLYLSRRIAQAHGTDLTVRSNVGEGSVFSFELEVEE